MPAQKRRLAQLEKEFQRSGNAMWIWAAIEIADMEQPLPTWIREYLRNAATELRSVTCNRAIPSERAATKAAHAIGVTGRAIKDHRDEQRARMFLMAFEINKQSVSKVDTVAEKLAEEAQRGGWTEGGEKVTSRTIYR